MFIEKFHLLSKLFTSETSGFPVTIRLLDPPLHEFLPEGDLEQIVSELASETGMKEEEIFSRIEKLSEVNPMLGFRGCRFECPAYKSVLKDCTYFLYLFLSIGQYASLKELNYPD